MSNDADDSAISSLTQLFLEYCSDKDTLKEIARMADDPRLWPEGHKLFQRIRQKTLKEEKSGDRRAICQYLFEEACAKTLYNLSGEPAPFDADSREWVIPNAKSLARHFGMQDVDIENRGRA